MHGMVARRARVLFFFISIVSLHTLSYFFGVLFLSTLFCTYFLVWYTNCMLFMTFLAFTCRLASVHRGHVLIC